MNSYQQQHFFAALRLLIAAFFTLIFGGCSLTTTPIKAEDKFVSIPSIRVAVNFRGDERSASEPQTGHAVDIGVTKSRGHDTQSLASGDMPIILDNTVFLAPQDMRNDFDMEFADISWRWRKFFAERSLGLEVCAGLGYSTLKLSVSSSSPLQTPAFASERFFTKGPRAGVGLIYRLNSGSSFQFRIAEYFTGADRGVTNMEHYELYFAKPLLDNFSLRAGYAKSDVYGQNIFSGSDFHVLFSGLALALDMNFDAR